jgi:predicted Zn-dependent protease
MMRDLRWYPAVCVTVLVAVVVVACETVPITGRSQLLLLSEGDEVRLGAQAYQDIVGKSKVSTDPAINAMVTRVGSRIAAVTGRSYAWEYKVIEDGQANAFALPGGKIAVYTGILPITRDEAGLAAVLGHEVAHVIARHSGERVSQQLAAQGLASLVVGGVLGTDPQTTQIVSGLFAQGLLLPWGRAQESEADHLGLIYMAKAGYDPRAARDLWVRMGEASKSQPRPPEFLSTHPSTDTRIKQIDAWLPEAMQHYRPR